MSDKESGAQGRQRRKAETQSARDNADPDATARRVAAFQAMPAFGSDSLGTIARANWVAGKLLDQVLVDATLTEPECRKQAKELIAVIGMTHSKALTEERLLAVERKIGIGTVKESNAIGEPVPASGGTTLRHRGRGRPVDAVSGSVSEFSTEGEGSSDG